MAATADYLDEVGRIVKELRDLGFSPVLVGGMALVVLGSRRVTRDFDFVVARPDERLEDLIDVFYEHGLELAARVDKTGDVTSTIDNRKVASARLRIDAPASAYFLNRKTGLRMDLLFDYPVPAAKLADAATRTKIRSHVFHVASEHDLLALKRVARKQRSVPGDAEDIAFLESRLKGSAGG
jgi:hypothetical protein